MIIILDFKINVYNLLILASVFIGVTFSLLLLFSKRINKKANRFLGLAALVIVLWNIWVLSHDLDFFRYAPRFFLVPLNFSLALGPLLYFYTKSISDISFTFSKNNWFHFIPVLFECLVHVIISFEALDRSILATSTSAFFNLIPLIQLLAICSVILYSRFALKEIKKYHIWLQDNYSNSSEYSLGWLYRLLFIFVVLWFLWIPYTLVDYFMFNFQLGIPDYYPIYLLMSVITIWISVEAYLKPEVVLLEPKTQPEMDKQAPTEDVIQKASWLIAQMESNQYYLNPELTLASLAISLNIHPNRLSKIINEGIRKSFSDFINEYRTKAIVARLNNPKYDHITFLGISFECGFNSKTTFNRVFKEVMGVTPFEYKKSLS
ncbi:helix-turn-helix domain-containing protein [Maribacter antarcticus]|uniref:helix-turn-helix domain-containing protein n=1 Tax=Maribacter antarcticus TaxID=505250 RepID=UPI000ADA751A|nr:helix-turn-helix domain-containing protein [Maribacter antarcticus]